jgi:hydroxymethylpyrimidine pyrophosphatase-like HAD family hydrolase
MYRLLALDIDGTLINSRSELTPAIRAALARADDAGIRVVLAPGRRAKFVCRGRERAIASSS